MFADKGEKCPLFFWYQGEFENSEEKIETLIVDFTRFDGEIKDYRII